LPTFEINVLEIEAEEAGNITTDDLNLGVMENDTIAEMMAAIIDIVNKNLRFDHT